MAKKTNKDSEQINIDAVVANTQELSNQFLIRIGEQFGGKHVFMTIKAALDLTPPVTQRALEAYDAYAYCSHTLYVYDPTTFSYSRKEFEYDGIPIADLEWEYLNFSLEDFLNFIQRPDLVTPDMIALQMPPPTPPKHPTDDLAAVQEAQLQAARDERRAQGEPVLVFNDRRGVYFGWTKSPNGREMVLQNARMCIYWCSGGALRLSGEGAIEGDRIAAEEQGDLVIPDVHAIAVCTPAAAAAWKAAPVSKS